MALRHTALIVALCLLVGCKDEPDPIFMLPDGGSTPDSGTDAGMDSGGPPPIDPDGPIVSVLSPTAPAPGDFSSSAILADDRVSVLCGATENPAGATLDRASVSVVVDDGAGHVVEVPAIAVGLTDEFEAEVPLAAFPNGAVTVRCEASDVEGRMSAAEIDTFVDQGPVIQIWSPAAGVTYSQQVDVVFSVMAAPVAVGDTLAAVDVASLEVSIAGYPITGLVQDGDTFTATIVFDDPMFALPLIGEHRVEVRASNQRTPSAVERVASVTFAIDDELGPDITIAQPEAGMVVAGILTVTANVSDPDGVVGSSVVATIAGQEFAMTEVASGVFEGSYDTNRLGLSMVFPTIIVRAQDGFGNQGQHGLVVTLDNRAPIADLDPPGDYREAKLASDVVVCSNAFDPVGGDAIDDGATSVAQLSKYRARVEDLGNGAGVTSEPGIYIPRANVDPDDVQLYVLDDTTQPIVVDTNGDGYCDELNPHLVPSTIPAAGNELARLDLVAITPGGDGTYDGETPDGICTALDLADQAPFCPATSPTVNRVIAAADGVTPAIFGIPPFSTLQCMGNAFDTVATNIGDGWACLAVRAVDLVGNVGVSRPLRVCYDHDASGADCGAPVPDCTGTYDPITDTVDPATPCTIEFPFPSNELRFLNE